MVDPATDAAYYLGFDLLLVRAPLIDGEIRAADGRAVEAYCDDAGLAARYAAIRLRATHSDDGLSGQSGTLAQATCLTSGGMGKPGRMTIGWTVERHLRGQPEQIVALYNCFIGLAESCGPFSYSVTKTAITLKGTRRGFAGVTPRRGSLSGYLDLQRRVEDPRIQRSTPYTKRLFVHRFRVVDLSELDDEFGRWLAEAYAVGAGAHLDAPSPGL